MAKINPQKIRDEVYEKYGIELVVGEENNANTLDAILPSGIKINCGKNLLGLQVKILMNGIMLGLELAKIKNNKNYELPKM